MKKILIIIISFLYVSCDLGELPIEPIPVEIDISIIPMGSDYMKQVFFSLDQNQVISQNNRNDWDMAFESKSDTNLIYLNSSKFLQIWHINDQSFSDPVDLTQADWEWDEPCLKNGTTAIGELIDTAGYFVVDLGLNQNMESSGYIKFQIINSNNNGYTFRYSSLDTFNDTIVSISKNDIFNKAYYSFLNNEKINIEPESDNWDLLFSTYTHIFDEATPYLVSGVLINSHQISVASDTSSIFEEINIEDVQNYNFSNCDDVIGYDWKTYSFESNNYTVDQTKIYIIKSSSEYFKLKFIDFYNDIGEKGFPQFKIQKL